MPYPAGHTRLFAGSAPVAKAPIRLALIATALAECPGDGTVLAGRYGRQRIAGIQVAHRR